MRRGSLLRRRNHDLGRLPLAESRNAHPHISHDGTVIDLEAQTLCVHGDTPTAIQLVKAIRNAFRENAVEVKPLASILN